MNDSFEYTYSAKKPREIDEIVKKYLPKENAINKTDNSIGTMILKFCRRGRN